LQVLACEALPAVFAKPPADFAYADDAQRHPEILCAFRRLAAGGRSKARREAHWWMRGDCPASVSIASTQYSATDCALPPAVGDHHARAVASAICTRSVPVAVHDHGRSGRGGDDVVGKLAAGNDAFGIAARPGGSRVRGRERTISGAARENFLTPGEMESSAGPGATAQSTLIR